MQKLFQTHQEKSDAVQTLNAAIAGIKRLEAAGYESGESIYAKDGVRWFLAHIESMPVREEGNP